MRIGTVTVSQVSDVVYGPLVFFKRINLPLGLLPTKIWMLVRPNYPWYLGLAFIQIVRITASTFAVNSFQKCTFFGCVNVTSPTGSGSFSQLAIPANVVSYAPTSFERNIHYIDFCRLNFKVISDIYANIHHKEKQISIKF